MTRFSRVLLWIAIFAGAFAFVEASVVVYLRALYYPAGFNFPLTVLTESHRTVEIAREAATLIMLVSVGFLAGTSGWRRFGYFLVVFGLWDILFYVWLKVMLDWPASYVDWDILFLIPLPWIGPVIAPVLVSLLMVVFGLMIVRRIEGGGEFRPKAASWVIASGATVLLLISFMHDVAATLGGALPAPYQYPLLVAGLLLYAVGFFLAYTSTPSQ